MYNLNDNEMFKYFKIPALDYAIANKKTIRLSHNPLDYSGCALIDEWEYLKETLKLIDVNLEYEGGFWYFK